MLTTQNRKNMQSLNLNTWKIWMKASCTPNFGALCQVSTIIEAKNLSKISNFNENMTFQLFKKPQMYCIVLKASATVCLIRT